MADSTLNRFVSAGTAAARAAYTPTPPTPASGPTPGYFWHETDTGDTYSWKAGTGWIKVNTATGGLQAANNLSDVASVSTSRTNLGLGTGDSPQFTAVNIGHASDTTLARSGAGDLTVEGNAIYRAGGTDVPVADGGTGASSAATARSNLGCNKLIFGIEIDGGGSVITTGVKGFVRIPLAHTITKVTLLSSDSAVTSGSIVIDVWRDSYANYPPTVADTITASAKPTLSSATKAEDSTLTGWSTSGSAGDIYGFKVDSVTSIKKAKLEIEATY